VCGIAALQKGGRVKPLMRFPCLPIVIEPDSMNMRLVPLIALFVLCLHTRAPAAQAENTEESFLHLPAIGSTQLHILAPTLLELTLVTTQSPAVTRPGEWDFVNGQGNCHLPAPTEFAVSAADKSIAVKAVGF